jgi:lysophospholipase L1-like esterase
MLTSRLRRTQQDSDTTTQHSPNPTNENDDNATDTDSGNARQLRRGTNKVRVLIVAVVTIVVCALIPVARTHNWIIELSPPVITAAARIPLDNVRSIKAPPRKREAKPTTAGWLDCLRARVCAEQSDPGEEATANQTEELVIMLSRCANLLAKAPRAATGSLVPARKPAFDPKQLLGPTAHTAELRVACIGDSITYGNGSHTGKRDRDDEGSYPLELEALFKQMAVTAERNPGRGLRTSTNESTSSPANTFEFTVSVLNYGKGSRTASDTPTKFSYRRTSEFDHSQAANPHIILFMLGTNDSKLRTWQGMQEYLKDLYFFIDVYQRLPTKPEIILLTPPPALSTLGHISEHTIRTEIVPAIRQAAAESNIHVVDIHGTFVRILTETIDLPTVEPKHWPLHHRDRSRPIPGDAYFNDGVHPTVRGHRIMATIVHNAICAPRRTIPPQKQGADWQDRRSQLAKHHRREIHKLAGIDPTMLYEEQE